MVSLDKKLDHMTWVECSENINYVKFSPTHLPYDMLLEAVIGAYSSFLKSLL